MARTEKHFSRTKAAVTAAILVVLMLATGSLSNAYAAGMDFKYDSLLVGVYNDSTMTDEEWRDYYTGQFETVYSDVYISSRPYDWYATQKGTKCSSKDCGVACVSMAMKWYDKTLSKSVNTIRDELGYYDRGMTNIDIDAYLTKNGIPHTIEKVGHDSLKDSLKNSNVVLIILKTDQNKYHAVMLNGTYKFNNKLYFTYYDPEGNMKAYDMDDIDYSLYVENYKYSIISAEELEDQLYNEWAAVIQPNDK